MTRMLRIIAALVTIAVVPACTTVGSVQNTLPIIPTETVFSQAVRDICFAHLATGRAHSDLAEEQGFSVSQKISPSLRQEGDTAYTADFTSAPLIIGISEDASRCTVTVIGGDYESFKALSEIEIDRFSTEHKKAGLDYISAVEGDLKQKYTLRFTLLSGDELTK